jgi:hypothetical protein
VCGDLAEHLTRSHPRIATNFRVEALGVNRDVGQLGHGGPDNRTMSDIATEVRRRRTFAIISHPERSL